MASACQLVLLFLTGNAIVEVIGHGMLLHPPSRVSLWRDARYREIAIALDAVEYTDNQFNCGGYWNQWGVNDGKCGICGDPYQGPRKSEWPGKYAKNIIVDRYTSGQVISVVIKLTSNHNGWFEFRLCPHNDLESEPDQSCLDTNLLQVEGGSGTRYNVLPGVGERTIDVKLPAGVTCNRCVLQWKYNTASNWGTCPDGTGRAGCGTQEQFYACADIRISGDGGGNGGGRVTTTTTVRPTTSTTTGPPAHSCRGAGALALSAEVAKQCVAACANGCCPPELCDDNCRN